MSLRSPGSVIVAYHEGDAGYGGRLLEDLARRLGERRVTRQRDGERAHAVVLVIGPSWDAGGNGASLQDPHDRLRRILEAAISAQTPIIPLLVDAASLPAADALPQSLAALADADPVRATDDYWEAAVDRLAERLRPRGRARILSEIRRRPRISLLTALLGAAATIIGILGTLGYFDDPEQGTLDVKRRAAAGVTLADYLRDFATPNEAPSSYPVDDDTDGYVYDVVVGLARPEGDRYSLRWTMRDDGQGRVVRPFRNLVGDRFGKGNASGLHRVWVPCPPLDGVAYVIEFALVNDSRADRPLQTDESAPAECRIVER